MHRGSITSPTRGLPLRTCRSSAALTAAVIAALGASAQAQRQFEELPKRQLPADRDHTSSMVFGDLDGDGDPDAVCGSTSGSPNRVYENDGAGVFTDITPSGWLTVTDLTVAIALGDVDRDGDLDLVAGGSLQGRLYLNDGFANFTEVTSTHMPASLRGARSLALGDIDGDGDLDIVYGDNSQNRLYLNDGAGIFSDATAAYLPVDQDNTESVVLGDVDGDGDLDLVCGNRNQQNRLYLNHGGASFADVTSGRMPRDTDRTESVVLGDVDGDGDLDLVLGTDYWNQFGKQNRLYLNDGNGTFTDETSSRMPSLNNKTRGIVLVDVDGDGDLDMLSANRRQQNRLYRNDGNGTFTDITWNHVPLYDDGTEVIAAADVDGDGDLDLACGNAYYYEPRNRLYLNDGSGSFTEATTSRLPIDVDETRGIALGDVDGDADLDIVCANAAHPGQRNRLYLNDGNGNFADVTVTRMPARTDKSTDVALGDVDGDGDLDIVFANYLQQNCLYLNNGHGAFSDGTAGRLPSDTDATSSMALADVDGDGDLDILSANERQQNRLYLNDGGGVFTDATSSRMPSGTGRTFAVKLGDVDGDGDVDVVWGVAYYQDTNRLYLNDGSGSFTDVTASQMPIEHGATLSMALGDVDGDGDLDIVCGNSRVPFARNSLYLNDGTGTFTDATAGRLPIDDGHTSSVALGDLDGDGDLDMVVGSYHPRSEQHDSIFLNDGRAVFTDASATVLPPNNEPTRKIALGDADGDGDTDIVFGVGSRVDSFFQNHVSLNLLRQLDTPYLLRTGQDYQLDVYARYGPFRAGDIAFPFLATGTATIPFPPLGTIRIDPNQAIALPPMLIPQPSGMASVTVPIPNDPAIDGSTLYGQAVLLQYPVQTVLTNATVDVIIH